MGNLLKDMLYMHVSFALWNDCARELPQVRIEKQGEESTYVATMSVLLSCDMLMAIEPDGLILGSMSEMIVGERQLKKLTRQQCLYYLFLTCLR